jgi:hypothetical protein
MFIDTTNHLFNQGFLFLIFGHGSKLEDGVSSGMRSCFQHGEQSACHATGVFLPYRQNRKPALGEIPWQTMDGMVEPPPGLWSLLTAPESALFTRPQASA